MQPTPTPSQYCAPASVFLPYPSPALTHNPLPPVRNPEAPNPMILPPNPTATGTPAVMPGMLNSTFTPTAGFQLVAPNEFESEESVSSEEPVVPSSKSRTPDPATNSHHRGRSSKRSETDSRRHSKHRYALSIICTTGCRKGHCK
jgi:hypothetical protein